jgi:hypothetical protein
MVSCTIKSGVQPEICRKERIIEMKFLTADEIRGMIKENLVKSSRDGYVLLRWLSLGREEERIEGREEER